MVEFLNLLGSYWELLAGVATAIGGYIAWKKKKQESDIELLEKLEELKVKFITKIHREIELTEELAEEVAKKNKVIRDIKERCPDCYEQYINDNKKPVSN